VNDVVADASALAAIVFQEPEAERMSARLDGARLFAPPLLRYELASVALKKVHRQPAQAAAIVGALALALDDRWNITWREVDVADAVLIAQATGLTPYDASYVWLAAVLGAELVTLDRKIIDVTGATVT
jgi:predicted nucleic acid-binding protein